ncbi:MAG: pyrroline-5-carboxylate reductase [Sphingomonadales bacterium]|nr:pyrroline-5-carboxylate reductase [Sphingomonadales bacterium]MBD3773567.1 pyrroline-5-carboxylate reductase [Paracoccaceae bacterium]
MSFSNILLVGCGNMGGAMLAGWLASGMAPAGFTVVDPQLAEAPDGVRLLRALPQERFDAVLLGIKPQLFGEVAGELAPLVGPDTVLLSILAGVDLALLQARLPDARAHVRVMPNLAAALGKSPVGLATAWPDAGGKADVAALMGRLGTPEWIAEEHFDLITALVGSGPGFVYRFVDALAQGAGALGLAEEQAGRLAVAMVEGASALAAASPYSPAELARRVASPGGTTQAGLDVLDRDDALARLVAETLRAARDRGAEMAAQAREGG